MPLFKQTLKEKFTPTEIKFSSLFKSNAAPQTLGSSVLNKVKNTLRKSGYTDTQISDIITKDQAASIKEITKIATALNKAGVFGFSKDPNYAIKSFLNKERVKKQSIAEIRKEHIMEAREEGSAEYGNTSLNQKGIGPNAGLSKEDIGAKRRTSSAASTLSGKSNSKPISSFGPAQRGGSGNISRPGVGNVTSGGGSFRPKF